MREAAALRGIQDFPDHSGCLSVVAVNRLGTEQVLASNEELMWLASSANVKLDRLLLVIVRELGPNIHVGIPVIVGGDTQVIVEVRVIDASTSASLATTQTMWRNGGSFVFKGVKTLDQDMNAAWSATLMLDQAAK